MLDRSHWLKFKVWAKSHSLHDPHKKLPLRWSVKANEELVDFIHGSIIGLLIGFIVGLAILQVIF